MVDDTTSSFFMYFHVCFFSYLKLKLGWKGLRSALLGLEIGPCGLEDPKGARNRRKQMWKFTKSHDMAAGPKNNKKHN